MNLGYEIFVGVLSILSILNIFFIYLVPDPDLDGILNIMNGLFSIIFLGDFFFRLATVPSKSHYFFRDFGWADLFASLPLPQFKILRVFRLFRVYRLMTKIGPKVIINTLVKDRAGSALYVLLLMGILVLEFGALAVLKAEKTIRMPISRPPRMRSGMSWSPSPPWGMATDSQPQIRAYHTAPITIIIGVGIFGTFTGFLANFFLSPAKKEEDEPAPES